jgi:glycosyltransferase 2 family protein
VETVLDAVSAFWDYLASVHRVALALAISCHLAKTVCASRAWRNVLVAAYPGTRVGWLPLYAAYVAGAGVNALFPARMGDVVRLTMAHRAIKGSTYTTLVSSSLVLAIVDALCVIALGVWIRANVAEFRQRVRQAFTVVRTPARWLRTVVAWQLAEWALRLATVWFMLGAFRIEQSARNVLLVQAAESLATVVPISPGGIGTQQALLVYTLRGSASRSALLAFSVGMKLTVTCVNVIVGFTAILLTLRTLRFRRESDPAAAADTS